MLAGLQPGQTLVRREVHEQFGGRQQGGIGPSTKAPVVLFFTDPATGHQHGYYDGWGDDGLLHYVGEGQRGDQQLTQGNKAILNHTADGRSLEGFAATGKKVTYLGEFELVDHYFTDAHETGDPDVIRQVVVFRMRPRGNVPVELPKLPVTPVRSSRVNAVPVEDARTERAHVTPNAEPREMERRESVLVQRYRLYMQAHGHQFHRFAIVPSQESRPLYCDLWDDTTGELVEAKGTVTRDHIRMAVGQLLDYSRFVDANSLAILLPAAPRNDLQDYLASVNITAIYPHGDQWFRHEPHQANRLAE